MNEMFSVLLYYVVILDSLEYQGSDRRLILKLILKEQGKRYGLNSADSG
jgi:hypothetical protein